MNSKNTIKENVPKQCHYLQAVKSMATQKNVIQRISEKLNFEGHISQTFSSENSRKSIAQCFMKRFHGEDILLHYCSVEKYDPFLANKLSTIR